MSPARQNKAAKDKLVVLVTCGSSREANRIARELVNKRLAACVNVQTTPVQSIYRWKGKVERAREYLLIVKTSRRLLAAARKEIEALHRYDVPEVIALPIVDGSPRYLDWLEESLLPHRKKK